ncbi:MAG TPA: T9SS type A sorting domain-containing protein [Flavipsychrobacter sp.]|nr:T9SS type A sorting domain-containing protein [Flavipsychrobacter sp.]
MIKRLLLSSLIISSVITSKAQVYNYNFGTIADSITSGSTTSPTFLPTPSGGATAYARVGTGGGKIVVKTHSGFGSNSSLRIQAPTGTSVNKFSLHGVSNPTTTMGIKVTFSIGDSVNSIASNVNSGTFYFFAGNGANFSNANQFSGTQVFAGVRLVLGASSAALSVRVPLAGWYSDPTAPLFVPYGTPITVALYMNNGTSSVTYTDINNSSRTLAAGYTDLFANGVYQTSVPNPGIASNTVLDDFMFYAESSTNNQANLFIDDIVYTNNIVNNTLPLKLSFFEAIPDNSIMRLFWKTEAESNLKEYIVQHSKDGKTFAEAGRVKSLKTNGSSYTFLHEKPSAQNFYRLQIMNEEGSSEYSHIITAKMQNASPDIKVWFAEDLIHVTQHTNATLRIYDFSGKKVVSQQMRNSDYAIDVSFLTPGSYIGVLEDNNKITTIKFVK